MAKTDKSMNKIWGVVGFEFIASIVFLCVAMTAGLTWTPTWQWWQTIAFSVGLVGAVSLFFLTFGNFGMMKIASEMIMRVSMITAISLIVISAGNWSWIGLVLVGYILSFMGSAWGMPKEW